MLFTAGLLLTVSSGRCNGCSCAGLEGRCNSDSVFTRSWLRQSNHAWQLQQVSQQVQQVSVDGPHRYAKYKMPPVVTDIPCRIVNYPEILY